MSGNVKITDRLTLNVNTVWLGGLMLLSAAGVICGAVLCGGRESFAAETAAYIADIRSTAPLWKIIGIYFRGIFILTAVCFLMGFSAAAQPAEAAVPFFFGTGLGFAAAAVCGSDGIFAFAALIPGAAAAAMTVAMAARESMRMSFAVFKRTFMSAEYAPADFKLYVQKFLIILAVGAAAAAADGISALLFGQ